MSASQVVRDAEVPAAGRRRLVQHDLVLIFVVALAVRLLYVGLRSQGGFTGDFHYDSGVYYAAADSLLQGRLPYRDFVLVHPPGVMLVLTPFALLGRLTSDQIGFVVGNIAFASLGAMNAVLVAVVARRLAVARFAAAVGGLMYALWYAAVGAEFSIRLEPLGNFCTLLGLLALFSNAQRPRPRAVVFAGAAFAAAASVKIWWAVPLVIVIGWQLWPGRAPRAALRLCAGAAIALVIIDAPFFVGAPRTMFDMIVADQLNRDQPPGPLLVRISLIAGSDHHLSVFLAAVFGVGLLVVAVLAWMHPSARLVVVLAGTQLAVLLLSPLLLSYYADYIAVPVCLMVAAAAGTVLQMGKLVPGRVPRICAVVAICLPVVLTGLVTERITGRHPGVSSAFPTTGLRTAVRSMRCVMSDTPMALIELDVLSRDLEHGCRNWVDVAARVYGIDRMTDKSGKIIPRLTNAKWQRDLVGYFSSGQAVMLLRFPTSPNAATFAAITCGGLIAGEGYYRLYATGRDIPKCAARQRLLSEPPS